MIDGKHILNTFIAVTLALIAAAMIQKQMDKPDTLENADEDYL